MAIPSRQIGWGTEDNLLWQISKQLERLTCVTAGGCGAIATTTTTSTTAAPAYKVFTALLTQSGGDNIQDITTGDLIIGTTYQISRGGGGAGADFTIVGAPNNDQFTNFIATGTTPVWGTSGELSYNTGAPVATVLENTIGNVWFTYNYIGTYGVNSDGLFTSNKTTTFIQNATDDANNNSTNILFGQDEYNIQIITAANVGGIFSDYDGLLYNNSIEIRVYN